MNCVIVDDEEMSRATIEHFVSQTESLNLLGVCSNAIEAANLLKNEKVDVLFLDVEMPEMSGLDLLKSVKNLPQVVLVTSKKEYAVEAFEYNVTDYMVKPVEYSRFLQAVEKVQKINTPTAEANEKGEIFIKSDSRLIKLNYDQILFIEALADYAVVNSTKGKHIIHSTMKNLEARLPTDSFIRVHRSFIVNLNKIEMIEDMGIIITEKSIPIGASYKERFMEKLNLL